MTKYCVIPGFGEYIMGTYPNADRECISSGGHVEDRGGGGCGSTQAVQPGSDSSGRDGSALGEAAIAPIRALRERLPESDVMRDLATVNFSPAVLRLLEEDPEIRSRVGDVVGMVSQFAFLALVDPGSSTLGGSTYGEDLHRWLVDLADQVKERSEDDDVRAAVDRLVGFLEQRVGQPVGALVDTLRGDIASAY